MKYRRKPQYVEAFQYDGLFYKDASGKLVINDGLPQWALEALADGRLYFQGGDLYTYSDELGNSCVMRNEFIVKDDSECIYNLPPELFTRVYERCGDDESFI